MEIRIEDDLDLRKIAESGQCFRWHHVSDGEYRIIHSGECLYIKQTGETEYRVECGADAFHAVWEPYFDLHEDYSKIRARIDRTRDDFLYRAAQEQRGIRILRQDPWETLVSFIISQNKNIPSIRKSIELLARSAGERRLDTRSLPYYAFPTPEAVFQMDAKFTLRNQ